MPNEIIGNSRFRLRKYALAPALVLVSVGRIQDTNALLALAETLLLVILAAGAILAAVRPSRGLQDRAAGTWVVPR